MIYDCFSFFNELDVLEIRLNTLNDVVDRFVLVEAPWTHTGKSKPLFFAENKQRFAPFLDKITHVVVTDADLPPFPPDTTERDKAWTRENIQRNAIVKGLSAAKPDDIILISDLDEIPDPIKIRETASASFSAPVLFEMRDYHFYLNMLNAARPIWRLGTKMLTWRHFTDPKTYDHFQHSDACRESINKGPTATKVRFLRDVPRLENAGWHFSYLGGIDAVRTKLESIAESYMAGKVSLQHIERCLHTGKDIFGNGDRFIPVPIDQIFPTFVRNSIPPESHLIIHCTNQPSTLRMSFYRIKAEVRDKVFRLIHLATPRCLIPLRSRLYSIVKGYSAK